MPLSLSAPITHSSQRTQTHHLRIANASAAVTMSFVNPAHFSRSFVRLKIRSLKAHRSIEQKYFPAIGRRIICRSPQQFPFSHRVSQLHRVDTSKVRLAVRKNLIKERNRQASRNQAQHPLDDFPFHRLGVTSLGPSILSIKSIPSVQLCLAASLQLLANRHQ